MLKVFKTMADDRQDRNFLRIFEFLNFLVKI